MPKFPQLLPGSALLPAAFAASPESFDQTELRQYLQSLYGTEILHASDTNCSLETIAQQKQTSTTEVIARWSSLNAQYQTLFNKLQTWCSQLTISPALIEKFNQFAVTFQKQNSEQGSFKNYKNIKFLLEKIVFKLEKSPSISDYKIPLEEFLERFTPDALYYHLRDLYHALLPNTIESWLVDLRRHFLQKLAELTLPITAEQLRIVEQYERVADSLHLNCRRFTDQDTPTYLNTLLPQCVASIYPRFMQVYTPGEIINRLSDAVLLVVNKATLSLQNSSGYIEVTQSQQLDTLKKQLSEIPLANQEDVFAFLFEEVQEKSSLKRQLKLTDKASLARHLTRYLSSGAHALFDFRPIERDYVSHFFVPGDWSLSYMIREGEVIPLFCEKTIPNMLRRFSLDELKRYQPDLPLTAEMVRHYMQQPSSDFSNVLIDWENIFCEASDEASKLALTQQLIVRGACLAQDSKGDRTPIVLAARAQQWQCVAHIASTAKEVKDEESYNYGSALILAAENNRCEEAKLLIANGVTVHAWHCTDNDNYALHQAVLSDQTTVEIFQLLIHSGADHQQKNKEGLTPITLAVRQNAAEKVVWMAEALDSREKKGACYTLALKEAIHVCKPDVIRRVLQIDDVRLTQEPSTRNNWLHWVVEDGATDVETLRAFCSDELMAQRNKAGNTPLMMGAAAGNTPAVVAIYFANKSRSVDPQAPLYQLFFEALDQTDFAHPPADLATYLSFIAKQALAKKVAVSSDAAVTIKSALFVAIATYFDKGDTFLNRTRKDGPHSPRRLADMLAVLRIIHEDAVSDPSALFSRIEQCCEKFETGTLSKSTFRKFLSEAMTHLRHLEGSEEVSSGSMREIAAAAASS